MKKVTVSLILVLLVVVITYRSSLNNGFVDYDDMYYINNSKLIKLSISNIQKIFLASGNKNNNGDIVTGIYSPLTVISFIVEYHFFGSNPFFYHLTNLILHILNCFLVYWMIFLLCRNNFISVLSSVVFGVHPLHVEPVAWIAGRKDLLYAFFFLLSIISYINYMDKKEKTGVWYVFSALFFFLSLLSKPMAVSLPFVILIIDYLRKRKFDRICILDKIPFVLLSFLFSYITIRVSFRSQPFGYGQESCYLDPLYAACISSYSLILYIFKFFSPAKLSCYYSFPAKYSSGLEGIYIISFLLTVFTSSIFFIAGRLSRRIIFGALFFLFTLLPVIIRLPPVVAADRFTYIPLIGIIFIVSSAVVAIYNFFDGNKAGKALLVVILSILIIQLSCLSNKRSLVWHDRFSLWNDVVKNYRNVPFAYINCAEYFVEKGMNEEAIQGFSKAIEYDPDYAEAYGNRGALFLKMGKYNEAYNDIMKAISLKPDLLEAHVNRGVLFLHNKLFELAKEDFNLALRMKPDCLVAIINRGNVYRNEGDYENAFKDYNRALLVDGNSSEAYLNRGILYLKLYKNREAIDDFNQALSIQPNNVSSYYYRIIAYYNLGEYDKVLRDIEGLRKSGFVTDGIIREIENKIIKK